MAMRKDYKAIANIIQHEYTRYNNTGENDEEGKQAITNIAFNISNYFTQRDEWFNQDTFISACGIVN